MSQMKNKFIFGYSKEVLLFILTFDTIFTDSLRTFKILSR